MAGSSMKKLFLVFCFAIIITPYCFSQEQKYGNLEFYFGMPFFNGALDHAGNEEKLRTEQVFSFGIGATNYSVFQNKNMGIVFQSNLIFPYKVSHSISGATSSYARNDLVMFDLLLGISYYFLERGNFKFPVTLGLRLFFMSGTSFYSSSERYDLDLFSLGLGSSIAAELHTNPSFYFFARLHVAFDFLTFTEHVKYTGVSVGGNMAYFIDGRNYTSFSRYFWIAPAIGIGLKLDGLMTRTNK